MQPTHCTHYSRADHTDNWSPRLGDERADRAWRIGDLRGRGVIVTLGSDWPIAPYDPRESFASAMLRRTGWASRGRAGQTRPGDLGRRRRRGLHERVLAIRWRGRRHDRAGHARRPHGAFARDPLTSDPDVFATSPVLLTVVDGDVVVNRVPALDAV